MLPLHAHVEMLQCQAEKPVNVWLKHISWNVISMLIKALVYISSGCNEWCKTHTSIGHWHTKCPLMQCIPNFILFDISGSNSLKKGRRNRWRNQSPKDAATSGWSALKSPATFSVFVGARLNELLAPPAQVLFLLRRSTHTNTFIQKVFHKSFTGQVMRIILA